MSGRCGRGWAQTGSMMRTGTHGQLMRQRTLVLIRRMGCGCKSRLARGDKGAHWGCSKALLCGKRRKPGGRNGWNSSSETPIPSGAYRAVVAARKRVTQAHPRLPLDISAGLYICLLCVQRSHRLHDHRHYFVTFHDVACRERGSSRESHTRSSRDCSCYLLLQQLPASALQSACR